MRLYDGLFDRVLTRTDPEWAHDTAFRAIRAALPVTGRAVPRLAGGAAGPRGGAGAASSRTPSGLAAGFDKDALGVDALAALGFGHVEVGTVTAEPQPGNARPRLFRLPADRAVVNRMGFNNDGAEVVAGAWRSGPGVARTPRAADGSRTVLGVNIGKTKVVPAAEARSPTTRSRRASWRRTPTTSSST